MHLVECPQYHDWECVELSVETAEGCCVFQAPPEPGTEGILREAFQRYRERKKGTREYLKSGYMPWLMEADLETPEVPVTFAFGVSNSSPSLLFVLLIPHP